MLSMLKIEAFVMVWNRYNTIHFTINHYKSFCSKVTILDHHSDDGTFEIAEDLGCEVKLVGKKGVLDDSEYVRIKNECWRGSDADWVIVVDDDEILSSLDGSVLNELQLAKDSGATIVHPKGFSIFSNEMPVKDWHDIQTGIIDEKYSKLCCFDPKKITDINYVPGCHEANPKGLVREVNKLWLLHYMAVGGAERMIDRHWEYSQRLSDFNKRWGCGKEYTFSPESKREWFQDMLARSAPLSKVG